MGECRIVSFVAAASGILAVEISAEIGGGLRGLDIEGPLHGARRTIATLLRGALNAIALSAPSGQIRIRVAEGGSGDPDQLAFGAALALLGAIGVLPPIVGRFAAFGALRPDGSIAPVEGADIAATQAAERGLGFICSTSQGEAGGNAGCVNVVAAPDLLAIVNDFRGLQPQPRPWQTAALVAGPPGLAEAPQTAFAARTRQPAQVIRRPGLMRRIFGAAALPARADLGKADGNVRSASSNAPPTSAQASTALPFATTGPAGHRARMRQRVLERGTDSLADYELLEMLLFFAFKTGDTKPLAKRLINTFGSFANVLAAPPPQLLETPGLGPHSVVALQLVRAAATRLALAEIKSQPILGDLERLIPYLTTVLAREPVEQFRVLFLDNRNRLLADEAQARGTVNHTPVYPREVAKRALQLHATALILVHNHPSGDPTPSLEDIEMTHEIKRAVQVLGIALHDHIIIGNGSWLSFRQERLL